MNYKRLLFLVCFLTTSKAATPQITISDLSPETVGKLQAFSVLHKGRFTIHYNEELSWLSSVGGTLFGYWESIKNSFTFGSICKTTFIGLMSLGWISYLICGILLYKGYQLAKSLTSWMNWCSDDDLLYMDEDLFYERLATHRSMMHSPLCCNTTLEEIRAEKKVIEQYLYIVTLLKEQAARLFPRYADSEIKEKLRKGYEKIIIAERLLLQAEIDRKIILPKSDG